MTESLSPTTTSFDKARLSPGQTVLTALLLLLCTGNGLFMLVDPASWYRSIDGVPATGPLNVHFVRDIGLTFLVLAAALAGALIRTRLAVPLIGFVALWFLFHAALHLWDVAAGRLGPGHLLMDAPGVFIPALVSTGLVFWINATQKKEMHS